VLALGLKLFHLHSDRQKLFHRQKESTSLRIKFVARIYPTPPIQTTQAEERQRMPMPLPFFFPNKRLIAVRLVVSSRF